MKQFITALGILIACATLAHADISCTPTGVTVPAGSACANIGSLGLTAYGDVNQTPLSPNDRNVVTSATLTTPRTWTLASTNAFPPGAKVTVCDRANGITAANTLTILRGGSDTIIVPGGTAVNSIALSVPGTCLSLISDAVNKWVMQSNSGVPISAFSAHKNAVDQTTITSGASTQITFSTTVYNIGGNFATNAWTPPAGIVKLDAAIFATGTITAGTIETIYIMKNAAIFKQASFASATNNGPASVSVQDIANGTDVYTVNVLLTTSAGTATVLGAINLTYFMGTTLK